MRIYKIAVDFELELVKIVVVKQKMPEQNFLLTNAI